MKEHILHTKWGSIYYWTNNLWQTDKPTIFCLHGLTADHTMFNQQFSFFNTFYNMIIWDAPGHGKSRPFAQFSMDIAVEIIYSILQKHNISRFIAIGQSYGGYIAQAFMCRYPNIISLFIGIGTSPYGTDYYSKMDFFLLRNMKSIIKFYPWRTLKTAAAKKAAVTKDGYDNMIQMISIFSKGEYSELLQQYYNAMMVDNRNLHITCPVLIMIGEHDNLGKVKEYCHKWHKRTGFDLVIIPHAGHNANVDNPTEVNKIINNFIKQSLHT